MRPFALGVLTLAASGCGGSTAPPTVDAPPSAACVEAATYQNLANIEAKIFKASCIFSGCHNGGATDAGKIDLRQGMAHAHLVDFDSRLNTGKLVVAGNPAASYLMVMIGEIAPEDASPPATPPPGAIGLMPQNAGGVLLCNEKREAISRWITAGALDD